MKFNLLITALLTLLLASCSSAGGARETTETRIDRNTGEQVVSQTNTTWGPTSLLGEQSIENYVLKNPRTGLELSMGRYSTNNPDRRLTAAGERLGLGWLTFKGMAKVSDNQRITDVTKDTNATSVKTLKQTGENAIGLETVKGQNAAALIKP